MNRGFWLSFSIVLFLSSGLPNKPGICTRVSTYNAFIRSALARSRHHPLHRSYSFSASSTHRFDRSSISIHSGTALIIYYFMWRLFVRASYVGEHHLATRVLHRSLYLQLFLKMCFSYMCMRLHFSEKSNCSSCVRFILKSEKNVTIFKHLRSRRVLSETVKYRLYDTFVRPHYTSRYWTYIQFCWNRSSPMSKFSIGKFFRTIQHWYSTNTDEITRVTFGLTTRSRLLDIERSLAWTWGGQYDGEREVVVGNRYVPNPNIRIRWDSDLLRFGFGQTSIRKDSGTIKGSIREDSGSRRFGTVQIRNRSDSNSKRFALE